MHSVVNKLNVSFFLILAAVAQAATPTVNPDRMRNFRMLETNPFLFEYHRITTGEDRQFFAYPKRNYEYRENFKVSEKEALIHLSGDDFEIANSFVGGVEYQGSEALADTIWPKIDGGIFFRGYVDSVDFALDARMYVESHSDAKGHPFDMEVYDVQNGDIKYISYSRYRGQVGLNWGHFRMTLARDVLHWGPGFYNNLTLNQFALPYNFAALDMYFGPLHIMSTYGDLRVGRISWNRENVNDRNMFAHRYELALGNLTLGMSEIQILYNDMNPALFVPIVPLFIEKGNYTEHSNNGALAVDFNYRLFSFARVYSEFFLDDLESPDELYKNEWSNNRWAFMAGMQVAHDFYLAHRKWEAGAIVEYARVEPYTYCHYDTAKAQLANLSMPLGNPNGPHSQTIDWLTYTRFSNVFLAVRQRFYWKGTNPGSSIFDPYKTVRKEFLKGVKMQYSLIPTISYEGQYVTYVGSLGFYDDPEVYFRLGFKW